MSPIHSAAGPMAGYLFQPERALYWLSASPRGSIVGIETCDDVVVIEQDGKVKREQDKHSLLPSSNPLNDKNTNLWTTLDIWLTAIEENDVIIDKTLFYFVSNNIFPKHSLVNLLGEAIDRDSVVECRKKLREIGEKSSNSYIQLVLSRNDVLLEDLIQRICTIDGNDSSCGDDLKEKVLSNLHIPPKIPSDEVFQPLLGWIHDTTMALLREGKSAWLTREAFDIQLNRIITRHNDKVFIEKAKTLIPVLDSERMEKHSKNFVRQLLLLSLKVDDDEIIEAIDDFIRCSNEINRFSIEGALTKEDVTLFYESLQERWNFIFKKYKRNLSSKSHDENKLNDIGYKILMETLNHREILAGQQTENFYLTKGSYHKLADLLKVGWHPNFEDLLIGESL